MKDILRIFRYLRYYKREVILNILSNLMYVFASLFSFALVIPFVSVLFGIVEAPKVCPEFALSKDVLIDYFSFQLKYYASTYGIYACLGVISLCFVVFSLFSAMFRYLGMYFLAPIRNGVIKNLRNDIYHKITILPLSFFSTQKKGDLISRTSSDLLDIEWSVMASLQQMIKDPLMVIIFTITLIIASPKLMLIVLVVMPLVALLIRRIGASLNRNSTKGQKQIASVIATTEESLGGIRAISAYNAQKTVLQKFKTENNRYSRLMTKILRRRELASPLTEIFGILALVIIVLFGGNMVLRNEINPALLIGFVVIFARIISPLQSVTTAYYSLKKAQAAASRIYEILDAQEKIEEQPNALEINSFDSEITYTNVSFSYSEEEGNEVLVLKDINLTIKKGETVAIVGPSGSGKSTLVDLLPRFHDVKSGSITIDSNNIRTLNINSLRRLIGVVTQDSILFGESIFSNIAFGTKGSMDEVIQAAKIANAHDFISKLPKGYYTNIGEEGLSLSGGERQRICIARAIYKNPPILLLDEATSALDTQNEHLVQQSLQNVMKGRTTLVVAHRLSTIMNADKIIVINQGRIAEQGTHDTLLEKNGLYAKLVSMQKLK